MPFKSHMYEVLSWWRTSFSSLASCSNHCDKWMNVLNSETLLVILQWWMICFVALTSKICSYECLKVIYFFIFCLPYLKLSECWLPQSGSLKDSFLGDLTLILICESFKSCYFWDIKYLFLINAPPDSSSLGFLLLLHDNWMPWHSSLARNSRDNMLHCDRVSKQDGGVCWFVVEDLWEFSFIEKVGWPYISCPRFVLVRNRLGDDWLCLKLPGYGKLRYLWLLRKSAVK